MITSLSFSHYKKKGTTVILMLVIASALAGFFLLISPVHAGQAGIVEGTDAVGEATGLGNVDPRIIVARVIRVFLGLLGTIALVLVLYAGFLYMTSGGDPTKVSKAKQILINAFIGLAIIASAFAIVSFIINALAQATGTPVSYGANGYNPPGLGSGGLGGVIQDHYPANNASVPRNTVIMVTFKQPIDPESIIANDSMSCIDIETQAACSSIAPGQNCVCQGDLDISSLGIYRACDTLYPAGSSAPADYSDANRSQPNICNNWTGNEPNDSLFISDGIVSLTPDFKTLVFNPYGNSADSHLGSPFSDVSYFALVTGNVKSFNGNTSIFSGRTDSVYRWKFTTTTNIDVTPPFITTVYPVDLDASGQPIAISNAGGAGFPRNTRVRVDFSEAVIPPVSLVLDATSTGAEFLILDQASSEILNGNITAGINQYRSLVYRPSGSCGDEAPLHNSCGEVVTCFPANATISGLVKSVPVSNLLGNGPTVALYPAGGIVDAALNALDTDGRLGKANGSTSGDNDNFSWNFATSNTFDLVAPTIVSVTPENGADKSSGVEPNSLVSATFSKSLDPSTVTNDNLIIVSDDWNSWFMGSLYCPKQVSADGSIFCLSNDKVAVINHGAFPEAKDNLDVPIIYPKILSGIQDMSGNCFNPCSGPGCGPMNKGQACCGEVEQGINVQEGEFCPY